MNDDELRAHFHALRSVDQPATPAFSAVRSRPGERSQTRRAGAPRLVWAFAAALVIAVGVTTYVGHVREPGSVVPPTPSILTWQSPTATLLNIKGMDMLHPASMTVSVLDQFIPAMKWPGGE